MDKNDSTTTVTSELPSEAKLRKEREEADSNVELYHNLKDATPDSLLDMLIAAILYVTGNEDLIPTAKEYADNPDIGEERLQTSDDRGQSVATSRERTQGPRVADKADITNDNNKPNYAVLNRNGTLVAGNKVNEKVDPASTTKGATLATIGMLIDDGKLKSSFVDENETLIKEVMENSNNHAAAILAEKAAAAVNGDSHQASAAQISAMNSSPWSRAADSKLTREFAGYMNEFAKENDMNDTKFVNSHGWPEQEHFSTARDMAVIMHTLEAKYPQLTERFMDVDTSRTGADRFSGIGGTEHAKTGTAGGKHGELRYADGESGKALIGGSDESVYSVAESTKGEYNSFVKEVAGIAGRANMYPVQDVGEVSAAATTAAVASGVKDVPTR